MFTGQNKVQYWTIVSILITSFPQMAQWYVSIVAHTAFIEMEILRLSSYTPYTVQAAITDIKLSVSPTSIKLEVLLNEPHSHPFKYF